MELSREVIDTPLGSIAIEYNGNDVYSIYTSEETGTAPHSPVSQEVFDFLAGKRRGFTFSVHLEGTVFQKSVWIEMMKIPYGETRTYGELASSLGKPGASRAVGSACNKNKLLFAVPCHRVVSSQGIGGFACGVDTKKKLLEIEQK